MKHYCVISHTHWDREWYLTGEQFRMRLVELMDHLLALLEREPAYIFHLDAQTIALEDYWEVKPENRERCCRFIREGRLILGPWYVQNDFLLTSGEATVRNLLLGKRQAEAAGGCDDTGYAPDQFGMISQLPQILRGFGMDNCVFGRGYRDFTVDEDGKVRENQLPSELIWRSPDGSEVFAVAMSFWYNNAQRFSADPERAMRLVKWQDDHFAGIAATPYLLLMNGVDHLEAQEDLLPILEALQKRLPEGDRIYQTTFHHYLDLVKGALAGKTLYTWEGEMISGLDPQVLKDCASTRVYIKTQNARLQNLLENGLEPLYALLEMGGMADAYPAAQLDYLWKKLIRNHAHDSICGCTKDAVQRHVEDRFAQIEEFGGDLKIRGLELLSAHVDRRGLDADDYLITVFNPLETARTECVEVTVDVLATDKPRGLAIYDHRGAPVKYTLLEHRPVNRRMISPINLPGFREVERYRIRMMAEDIPGFGYGIYRVRLNGEAKPAENAGGSPVLENENLRVEVREDGTVDLLHKNTGHWYRDVLVLEDRGDAGHSYISIPVPGETPLHLKGSPRIRADKRDELRQKLTLTWDWQLPARLDREAMKRSSALVSCPVTVELTLDKGSPRLDVTVKLDNRAEDHRLLALIRTGLDSDVTQALSPYDLVRHDKQRLHPAICNESRHNSGLIAISGDALSMSVLNEGLYSYENLQREKGTVSLTLLRATSRVWPPDSEGYPEDDSWEAPENQCLRRVEVKFALRPGCGEADLFGAKQFQNPLLAHSCPVDTRKFLGGRPALQDANIDENFYQADPYPAVRLPMRFGAWELEGQRLQVTAWKKCYDRSDHILRFFSAADTDQTVTLTFRDLRVSQVWKTDLQEQAREALTVCGGAVRIPVRAHEIVTLILKP